MGLAIGLVVLAIGFGLIEWKWPAVTKRWWRRGMATDLIYWFFTPVVTKALAVIAVVIVALYAIGLHANVRWTFGPLRYMLASPTFHRWHHTSEDAGLDKNFAGLFPIWDLMFGTFYLPRTQPTRFGVSDPVPDGIIGQLVWPFRNH